MAKELIINASLPEVRIALMEDGRIQELLIERASDKGIVGNIYKGRVTRVLPGMQAAFVDVGLDKAAFLYVDDIYVHPKVMGEETEVEEDEGDYSHEGDEAPGEASQDAQPAKVTPKPSGSFVSRGATITPKAAVITAKEPGSENAEAPVSAEGEMALSANDTQEEAGIEAAAAQAEEASNEEELHAEVREHHEHQHHEFEAEESEESESDEAFEAAHDFEGEEENEDGEDDSEEGSEENTEEGSEEGLEASGEQNAEGSENQEGGEAAGGLEGLAQPQGRGPRGANTRGRNRNRKRGRGRRGGANDANPRNQFAGGETGGENLDLPESFNDSVNESGQVSSDRAQMEGEGGNSAQRAVAKKVRPEFREPRTRDRRIKTKNTRPRAQASIADLLKEGQEVIVQIAKDPIATKGARLTCHVSLPGRHLVCMPSIDHVGVSRRIERDDERRRLRDFVERNRPRKMGFIVRTASGGKDPESWIKQDIDYLSKLWGEIRGKADEVSAPALVYEDLNSILRAIRDWVNEDIDKIIVDSRYHYNELQAFADRFMPALHEKLELYHGDVPIFDAYGISSELHRSLERKVWLKSGGYLVIDQAEALVAIDVNTGRYVGKKSLEDTILKTNIEAAEEIAHQLRLRNCGGIIICDFIDMERDDNRMRVYRALDEALKKDRARPTIQKISELGLVEMTRKRTRDTIIRTLCEPCTHCEGKGFVKSTTTVAYEILREIERLSVDREAKKVLVSAHESVVNVLAIELRDALDQLERRYNKTVYLQSVMDFHAEQFEVVTDRAGSKKGTQDIARQLRVERERSERKEKNRSRNKPESHEGDHNHHDGEQEEVQHQSQHQSRGPREPRQQREPRVPREQKDQEPKAPIPRPSGAFVTTRAGAAEVKPAVITMRDPSLPPLPVPSTQAAVSAGEGGDSNNEDAQPSFTEEGQQVQHAHQSSNTGYEEELNDEDQLAYLRAQAAQDAAIAGLSQNAQNANRGNPGRGGGRGDQQGGRGNAGGGGRSNNRNQNQRGGGRNNPQQARGPGGPGANGNPSGQRFKPHHRGPGPVIQANSAPAQGAPAAQPSAPVETQIPDYEVISRNDGSDS